MGKVESNKRIKRLAILDAALDLFTEKGLNGTSISEIAHRSGVAKGTFYLYFKDKYDIRNKLVVYQSRRMLKEACDAMLVSPPEALEDQFIFITDHVLNQLSQRRDLLLLISKNLSWGILKQELRRVDPDSQEEDFTQAFHNLTAPHGISPEDSEIMLYLIVELVSSACYNPILYSEPCDLDTLKTYLFESIRRIVRQFEGQD